MSRVVMVAELTGYVVWFAVGWALLNRFVTLLARLKDERRRWRNARRMERFRPQARPRDPGTDLTKTLPAIQRPRGGSNADRQ
jgi:hypothetical protein